MPIEWDKQKESSKHWNGQGWEGSIKGRRQARDRIPEERKRANIE
jgi:hypothetical protein